MGAAGPTEVAPSSRINLSRDSSLRVANDDRHALEPEVYGRDEPTLPVDDLGVSRATVDRLELRRVERKTTLEPSPRESVRVGIANARLMFGTVVVPPEVPTQDRLRVEHPNLAQVVRLVGHVGKHAGGMLNVTSGEDPTGAKMPTYASGTSSRVGSDGDFQYHGATLRLRRGKAG